jgi:alkanesulfonate monooxygenase SsuD/methylene tetrahydromethanopterin reductase-like flavin-dependent oxidoreductase (luciferase family)
VNPVDMKERFWESADLILAAWQAHDGPFNWEGRHYHHRQVNVWPRCYQEPHPPVWIPTQSTGTVVETAQRQWNLGTILSGTAGARKMFDAYRAESARQGIAVTAREKLGYVALVHVGETEEEGLAGARQLQWYLRNNKVAPQFNDVPGYLDVQTRAQMLKRKATGGTIGSPIEHLINAPVERLTAEGYAFAGSPDSVFRQLRDFYGAVGGFGNFIMMVQAGTMGYEIVERSMRLFAREVLPRFRAEVYACDPAVEAVAAAGG